MMFDKIFYINLDRRPDRDKNVKSIISKFKLQDKIIRVPAIDGSKLNLNTVSKTLITKNGLDDAKNVNQKAGIPLTPGGIGCALSHRTIWKKIFEDDNISCALILE